MTERAFFQQSKKQREQTAIGTIKLDSYRRGILEQ